jgi:hypothetical protein
MSPTALGSLLAFGAAIALNGSYLVQHAGSAGAPAVDPRRPLRTLTSLLRSPLWSLGALLGMSGWALHIAAMREAPLSLVQAFVAGGLALTAPMAALGLHRRLEREERVSLVLMVIALLALALGLRGSTARPRFSGAALGAWIAGLAVLAAVLAAAVRGPRRAYALGLAGGLLYGAADLALKAATGVHADALLGSPWPWAAAVTTVGAFFAFQRGLQGNRPVAVIALMTAGTNVGSILGALVVLGEPLGRTPALAVVHGAAFALVVVAAWRLAPAQARLAAGAPLSTPTVGGAGPASAPVA